jgi:hypothetical protein
MKRLNKVGRADWKYVPVDADIDFSPEHNKKVIEDVIKKHDAKVKAIMRDHDQKVGERTDAATTYLKSLEQGKGESDIHKYFGEKILAKLQAQNLNLRMKALSNAKTQS